MNDNLSGTPYAAMAASITTEPPPLGNEPYDYQISQLLAEAWQLTKGAKGIIIAALILSNIINIIPTAILTVLLELFVEPKLRLILDFICRFVISLVTISFSVGVYMIGIRRAANQPINATDIFNVCRQDPADIADRAIGLGAGSSWLPSNIAGHLFVCGL